MSFGSMISIDKSECVANFRFAFLYYSNKMSLEMTVFQDCDFIRKNNILAFHFSSAYANLKIAFGKIPKHSLTQNLQRKDEPLLRTVE